MIKTIRTTDLDELTAVQEDWEIQHRPVGTDRFEGSLTLVRQAKLGASCRVKVPVGEGSLKISRKG